MKPRRKVCVGCQESRDSVRKVEGLGYVCDLCYEVLDLVWEIEIERVREARSKIQKFLDDLQSGKL